MIPLEQVVELANDTRYRDGRPSWLWGLPEAADEGSLYYRFFFHLVERFGPLDCIEIGTYLASATAHLAYRNAGRVVSLDIDPQRTADAGALCAKLDLTFSLLTGDSLDLVKTIDGTFDLCFLDGEHELRQTYAEYLAYRDLVRDGGLVFFDDITLNSSMRVLWDCIPDPKARLDFLHVYNNAGFGVCQKDPAVVPRSLEETWAAFAEKEII
jgi:predicted O-methyltransferase YrrM